MGTANHYDHFLERTNRIEDEQLDFAMALYYDAQFVRAFLGYYQIPPKYERVAIALAADEDSPHVVLARDGGFITCLGRGMSIRGLYRIPYAKIQGHKRVREMMYEAVMRCDQKDLSTRHIIAQPKRRNLSLSRRDFERLEAVQPLFFDHAFCIAHKYSKYLPQKQGVLTMQLGKRIRRLKPAQEASVRSYWESFFNMHHLSVLVAMGSESMMTVSGGKGGSAMLAGVPWWSWREGMSGPSLRAMWCAGRMGDLLDDSYFDWLRGYDDPELINCGVASLLTIALRHPGHYRSIERFLRGWRDGIGQIPEKKRTQRQQYRHILSTIALSVLDDPEAAERDFCYNVSLKYILFLMEHGFELDCLEELSAASPLGSPLALDPLQALGFATLETADIRAQLEELRHLFTAAPLVARAAARDLYAPTKVTNFFADWKPDYGIALFNQHAAHRYVVPPVTVDKTPGRNDPCACGSGRKYKRCCLHQQA